ncbi:PspC domain protein [Nocardioides dokdonensis FR1436]|uniref:PspC domain protein n=1 Tax=Nocardioides dokdonensis FR1436 TaxID=1300347 RepID=A0A1A9GEI5_9ACTN|nr:PspC domain-containing protein [Nocardioides dokdonensis]ANH36739.1 PspC domain protein [Nocardioides dokdonensis FR1436]
MTTTPPEAPEDSEGPRVSGAEVRDLARLRRSTTDRKIAGVAGGLGRHLDIDPVIVRVLLVVLIFFGGAGLIVYAACWLFVPEDDAGAAPVRLDDRSRTVVLLLVGGLAVLALLSDVLGGSGGDDWWFLWPLLVVGLLVAWFVTRRDRRSAAATGGGPPAAAGPTAPLPAPRAPRRRGPLLLGFTLALIALAVGVLGTVDLAGASVPAATYPATALAVVGLMLVIGAFFGRAGGLILVGLLLLPVLGVASAADHSDGEDLLRVPATAAGLADAYRLNAGEMVIDLSEVSDLEELDGRTLTLDVDLGRIEVIVPAGLEVRGEAAVSGPGHIDLFGNEAGGIDTTLTSTSPDRDADAPLLRIDAEIGVGQIEMRTR